MSGNIWLITGCSSGFGQEIAKQVLESGDKAVVTARKPEALQPLLDIGGNRAVACALDVTDSHQIKAAVETAKAAFGQIDVLVNNAGVSYLSSIEEGATDKVRGLFETNFFGPLALAKAVLPEMRVRRSGRMIFFSSVGGLAAFPASGYYAATKFAIEGLVEALAQEVAPFGVKVTLIEPGPFRTGMGERAEHAPSSLPEYEATVGARRRQFRAMSDAFPGDPVRGSEAVLKIAQLPDPPLRLLLGKSAYEVAKKRFLDVVAEFDEWRTLTFSADFPGEDKKDWSKMVKRGKS
jgi:NAD(P)-dependent dehydrogenase (short-subunit alcohol dehydrogenase family)